MDKELAIAQLKALLKVPGALRIITNEVKPEMRMDKADPRSPLIPDLAGGPRPIGVLVVHDVAKISGPDERGRYIAHSEEGDWCRGYPVELLARLTEANQAAQREADQEQWARYLDLDEADQDGGA